MGRPPRPLIIPVFIPHAGCPHQCVFCNQHAITGAATGPLSAAAIQETIAEFLAFRKNRPVAEISFYGGNFLGLPAPEITALLEIAASYAYGGQIDGIRFSTRPDTVTPERLALLSNYPVSTVELGIQSMNDRVLSSARRGHTAADAIRAAGRIREKNYNLGLQMMTGLPGDTPEKSIETATALAELHPDFVRIYPTLVIAESPLARWYREGTYVPMSMEETVRLVKDICKIFEHRRIPVARIGLQASKELNDSARILAGPFHPALGHMVRSEMMLDAAVAKLKTNAGPTSTVTLTVHPRSLSRMQGLNKINLDILKREFKIKDLRLQTDPALDDQEVRLN